MIICGLHEEFMKIGRLGLELRIVCCNGIPSAHTPVRITVIEQQQNREEI